jgi:hypothetical protein
MVFNPNGGAVNTTLRVPLYYSGLDAVSNALRRWSGPRAAARYLRIMQRVNWGESRVLRVAVVAVGVRC